MIDTYGIGSKVRVKASPNLPQGVKDFWAGVEGVVSDESVSLSGAQSVKITHDPHHRQREGAIFRLSNLELVEGTVTNPKPKAGDLVEHPAHYGGDTTYEVIKVIEAWGLGFVLGNVVKYIARAGKKPGNSELQDLKKARDYLNKAIDKLEEN